MLAIFTSASSAGCCVSCLKGPKVFSHYAQPNLDCTAPSAPNNDLRAAFLGFSRGLRVYRLHGSPPAIVRQRQNRPSY